MWHDVNMNLNLFCKLMGLIGLIVIVVLIIQMLRKYENVENRDIIEIRKRNKKLLPYLAGTDVVCWIAGYASLPIVFFIGFIMLSAGGYVAFRIYNSKTITDRKNKACYCAIPMMFGGVLILASIPSLEADTHDGSISKQPMSVAIVESETSVPEKTFPEIVEDMTVSVDEPKEFVSETPVADIMEEQTETRESADTDPETTEQTQDKGLSEKQLKYLNDIQAKAENVDSATTDLIQYVSDEINYYDKKFVKKAEQKVSEAAYRVDQLEVAIKSNSSTNVIDDVNEHIHSMVDSYKTLILDINYILDNSYGTSTMESDAVTAKQSYNDLIIAIQDSLYKAGQSSN